MGHAAVRVLHVDDDPEFGDLTATFLEREDDRLSVETATSAAEGLELIHDFVPDCVVSDHDMPGQNGIEFLQKVREDCPELPFILFTGKGSEEVASEAISVGVTDYLQKGSGTEQYELLANRITNAVRARQSAERLSRQEELMRLTEETADIGGWELDLETDQLQITPGAGRLTGLEPDDDLSPDDTIDLYHPDDRPEVRAALDRAADTGEEVRDTWRIQPPDGGQRTVNVTITPVSSNGEVTKLRGAIHDITERQERRRELEQVETLFEHTQGPLFLVEVGEAFTFQRVNQAFEDAIGISADRVQGEPPRELFGAEQGAEIEQRYRECIERGGPLEYEERLQFGDETTYWETRIAPVVIDGDVAYIAGSTNNVTHTRERQRELRLLQQAIDDANVAITLADPSQEDNPLVYVNDAYEELTGYSEENTLGRNWRYLQGENTDPENVSALREAIDNEEPITVELRNYRKDGTEFWNHLTVTPIYDDDGHLVRYLGTQQDVTERKEREQELRAEREFTEQALDALDDLFYVFDTDGRIKRHNEQLAEITGYDPAELDGLAAAELFPEDEQQTVADSVETTLEVGEITVEADLLTADGQRIPYEFTGARLTDVDGNTTGLVGVGRDITERRRREHQSRQIMKTVPGCVVKLDAEGEFVFANERAKDVLGLDSGGVTSRTYNDPKWDLQDPSGEPIPDEDLPFSRIRDTGEPVYGERHGITWPDGTRKLLLVNGAPVFGEDGSFESAVFSLVDITDREERQRELERQNDRLDEFASVVSHDLRNPLNIAEGRLELAQAECDSPHLDGVAGALDRMDALIEDLLTLARGGEAVGSTEAVSVSTLAEECWEVVPEGTATLTVETDRTLSADRSRLRQVLENLFVNAAEHGGESVTVRVGDLTGGFYVADDGAGIPEGEREDVFEAGYSTAVDGTGFGLRIVRRIVDAHGWEIEITDSVDDGARIEITGVDTPE